MAEIGTGKKSFPAMFLSIICPGLGQFYLRKFLKGTILFLATAVGILLLYFNSLPVDSVFDLFLVGRERSENSYGKFKLKLKNPESEDYEYTIFVILSSSNYKTIEKDIKEFSAIRVFGYSILSIFMDTGAYEKTQIYEEIKRFNKRELKFGPIWQFRISGLLQVLFFWGYSIWDGFLGYKRYKQKN